jgi:hypothetical protein
MVITPEDVALIILAYLSISILIAVAKHKYGKYDLYDPIEEGSLYFLLPGASFVFVMLAAKFDKPALLALGTAMFAVMYIILLTHSPDTKSSYTNKRTEL